MLTVHVDVDVDSSVSGGVTGQARVPSFVSRRCTCDCQSATFSMCLKAKDTAALIPCERARILT